MRTVYLLGLLALFSLMACQTAEVSPTPTSTTPTTAAPTPTPPPATNIAMGQTAEGAFYKGSPDAPVKLYDFSNFL